MPSCIENWGDFTYYPPMNQPKLLIFVEYYLPGYKSGGPVQSVYNLIRLLKDSYTIYVITRDRDYNDTSPYPGIKVNTWLQKEGYKILYNSPDRLNLFSIHKLLKSESFDYIYANSLFGKYTRILLVLSLFANRKIIIAPRGEVHEGALRLKQYKKKPFLWVLNFFPTGQIIWHATDMVEMAGLRTIFPKSKVGLIPVVFAPDTPKTLIRRPNHSKDSGKAKLVFVSRITTKKGLLFLAEVLRDIHTAEIELTIYGPIEDVNYWKKCQKLFATLPHNCSVRYAGVLPHDQVTRELEKYDFFVLPTFGENFGHAIFEAFSVGLPVLISDQTQWRQLRKFEAGWDTPLIKEQWVKVLEEASAIGGEMYKRLADGAYDFSSRYLKSENFEEKYRVLFS